MSFQHWARSVAGTRGDVSQWTAWWTRRLQRFVVIYGSASCNARLAPPHARISVISPQARFALVYQRTSSCYLHSDERLAWQRASTTRYTLDALRRVRTNFTRTACGGRVPIFRCGRPTTGGGTTTWRVSGSAHYTYRCEGRLRYPGIYLTALPSTVPRIPTTTYAPTRPSGRCCAVRARFGAARPSSPSGAGTAHRFPCRTSGRADCRTHNLCPALPDIPNLPYAPLLAIQVWPFLGLQHLPTGPRFVWFHHYPALLRAGHFHACGKNSIARPRVASFHLPVGWRIHHLADPSAFLRLFPALPPTLVPSSGRSWLACVWEYPLHCLDAGACQPSLRGAGVGLFPAPPVPLPHTAARTWTPGAAALAFYADRRAPPTWSSASVRCS